MYFQYLFKITDLILQIQGGWNKVDQTGLFGAAQTLQIKEHVKAVKNQLDSSILFIDKSKYLFQSVLGWSAVKSPMPNFANKSLWQIISDFLIFWYCNSRQVTSHFLHVHILW